MGKKKKAQEPEAKVVDVEIVDDESDVIDVSDASESSPDPSDIIVKPSEPVATSNERGLVTADPVAMYMAEVRKYPLLSKEEERELAVKLYETGDQEAAEKLVTSNLRFVVKVAAEYAKFGAKLIDLVQEGNIGLMHAVKEFNPYKNVRLITYAVWWIRGYIQEYLMKQHSLVKIGTTQNQRKLFYRLQKEKDKLDKLGEDSNAEALSKTLGVSVEEVRDMAQRLGSSDLSLDYTFEDGGRSLLESQDFADEQQVEDLFALREELSLLGETIDSLKEHLNEREIEILEDRLLSDTPLKLQEIGEKHGVSREAVRQMEARLMKKLKESLEQRLIEAPKTED
jgi:RNA polymerase sigma-32 factor